MNQLITTDVKMTSVNIANVTGKRHADVMRDIRKEIDELGEEISQRIFAQSKYTNERGRNYDCYTFGKEGAMQLALKYDAKTRYNVIQYVEKLENKPVSQLDILQGAVNQLVQQENRLIAVEKKQDEIGEIITLNTQEWRRKANKIINSIANKRGGFEAYSDVRNESYELLEERAKCRLSIRLTNRKSEMALNGASQSKIRKLNNLDVIESDARLTEIYLAIIKEMAIKYGVESGDFK